MDRESSIHKHETWTEKVPYTNTEHGQKKYHMQTITWTEKVPYTKIKNGQKKYHTQTLNMDRKSTIHKH